MGGPAAIVAAPATKVGYQHVERVEALDTWARLSLRTRAVTRPPREIGVDVERIPAVPNVVRDPHANGRDVTACSLGTCIANPGIALDAVSVVGMLTVRYIDERVGSVIPEEGGVCGFCPIHAATDSPVRRCGYLPDRPVIAGGWSHPQDDELGIAVVSTRSSVVVVRQKVD